MGFLKCRRSCRYALHAALTLLMTASATGQATKHYDASISSLDQHPLPQWFDDAKLGISSTGDFIRSLDGRRSNWSTSRSRTS